MSKNPVVHFEMPYQDAGRVAAFYKTAFGWDMQNLGDQMGGYVMARTADTDETGMPKAPGTINGGFYGQSTEPDMTQPSVVIAVEDLDKAIQNVTAAGDTILKESEEITGVGRGASFRDTEGNLVSMLQPAPRENTDTVEGK